MGKGGQLYELPHLSFAFSLLLCENIIYSLKTQKRVYLEGEILMYIIAGLGNPGREYESTRHNAGFLAVDYLANICDIKINKSKFKALCGEGTIAGDRVVILKPQTYMNLSGESILDAVQFYKINTENIIIVYDDVSIPLGRIRIRPSGSDGGHNGMKSIIYLLGSDSFPRVRIGIGEPDRDMVEHVLGRFNDAEQNIMIDTIKVAAEGIKTIVSSGTQEAMNRYNSYRHPSIEDKDS